jgi:hypothetical protein
VLKSKLGAPAPPYVTLPRKRGSHKPVFSCNSIGAPSNCKKEFAGVAVAAIDGAVDVAVVAVLDGTVVAALEGGAAGAFVADALTAEVVGATTGVAVVGTAGLATTGLAATAPAVAGLCAKTVEAPHNGKTTTPKAQTKVWCCVAADLINSDMGFMIKG